MTAPPRGRTGQPARRGGRTTVARSQARRRRKPVEATFCFVDIAGFTALTETHGPHAAADLIDRFTGLAERALRAGDRVVDRAGDAIFLVSPRPRQAIALLRRLFRGASRVPGFPILRAGLHFGTALEQDGAYFGADVNLAARVAAEARGDRVLATVEVAEAARRAGLAVASLGRRRLRHIRSAVEIFEIDLRSSAPHTVTDPVCKMRVDPAAAPARLRRHGRDHWFCSLECAAIFASRSLPSGSSGAST